MSLALVTGGAGFIGSHLVEGLLEQGFQVRVLDDLSTGSLSNLQQVAQKIEFIEGDIRDPDTVAQAVAGTDYILHQAARPSVMRSIEDPLFTNQSNVNGTLNLLWAAQQSKVKRLIYASSSSVYGNNPILPKQEEMPPKPISPYSISKLAGELYVRNFYRLYGLETVALRYFNVYGPRQNPQSQYAAVVPKFTTLMMADKQPTIYGDGEQTRDFTFVGDVVQANLLALEAKNAPGQVINIAEGKRNSVNHLVEVLNQVLGKDLKPQYTEARAGEVEHSQADIGKARQILAYQPKYSLKEGLEETSKWFSKSP